jgi:hypothetical protein
LKNTFSSQSKPLKKNCLKRKRRTDYAGKNHSPVQIVLISDAERSARPAGQGRDQGTLKLTDAQIIFLKHPVGYAK